MQFDGYFINLDRSQDRRKSMETQLARLGYQDRIVRFPAVNGFEQGPFDNAGENGIWACRQSHERVILNAPADTATVVLEDDVELSSLFPTIVNEQTLAAHVGSNPDLDMMILDCCPLLDRVPLLLLEAEKRMKRRADPQAHGDDRYWFDNVSLLDATQTYGFCSAAYIVTPKGKRTLRALFSSMEDKAVAVDMLFRHWLRFDGLSAQLVVPFIATPKYMSSSTISYDALESPVIDESVGQAIGGIRRLLFAGDADLDMNRINALIGAAHRSPEYKLGVELSAVALQAS
jgi:GR25 family glycosyltransferase involved in LPS biosynthesis